MPPGKYTAFRRYLHDSNYLVSTDLTLCGCESELLCRARNLLLIPIWLLDETRRFEDGNDQTGRV